MNTKTLLSVVALTIALSVSPPALSAPTPVMTSRPVTTTQPVRVYSPAIQSTRSTNSTTRPAVNTVASGRSANQNDLTVNHPGGQRQIAPSTHLQNANPSGRAYPIAISGDGSDYSGNEADGYDTYAEETGDDVEITFGPWEIVEPSTDDADTESEWDVLSSARFVKVISDGEVIDYCVEHGPAKLYSDGTPVYGRPEFIEPSADCERIYELEQRQEH